MTATRQNTADPVDTRPRVPWITAAQLDALSMRGALTRAELRYLADLDATGDAP